MSTDEAEFLQIHRDFGHLPFSKLREMATQGVTPAKFAKRNIPACSACMTGMMTKSNWRNKLRLNHRKQVTTLTDSEEGIGGACGTREA